MSSRKRSPSGKPVKRRTVERAILPVPEKTTLDVKAFIKEHERKGATGHQYDAATLIELCRLAKTSFSEQATLLELELDSPIAVCGDTHGFYSDLLRILNHFGQPGKKHRYLFLGDYVDRGKHSLEVVSLLFAYKIANPNALFLLRGNHEFRAQNSHYGFHAECIRRFGDTMGEQIFETFNSSFEMMPLAATIAGTMLLCHGGISRHLKTLEDIRQLERPIETDETPGLVQDLVWADPSDKVEHFKFNTKRNISYWFGAKAFKETIEKIGITHLIRAHEVPAGGYTSMFDERCWTVFSASNYNERNKAAVARIATNKEVRMTVLEPGPDEDPMTVSHTQ